MTSIVRVRGYAFAHKIGATHYHAQLGLPDRGRAIEGLDVCCVTLLGVLARYIAI